MNGRKSLSTIILIGVLALMLAPISNFAATETNLFEGTATGSKNSGRVGGQNCGKISKQRGKRNNTGAMTVTQVTVDGTALTAGTDYTIRAGTDGSTRPVIEFSSNLAAGVDVEVELSTIQDGEFTVNLDLTRCRN